MFRKPAFWILFVLASAGAAFFAWTHFSTAFPLVSIDLRMDRNAALDAARSLAVKHAWLPSGFAQVASFSADQEVQNFVELEGGGKDILRQMILDKTYAPYTWTVRHFKEGDPHEVTIQFTPEGQPYGFRLKLPEKESGADIGADAARKIAEDSAAQDWHADLQRYPLAESSQELRPGGRRDHFFVYERQDIRVGEGRYRLRLVVAGDKLSELTYFVQVPEAFTRRYEEMRTTNSTISALSGVGVIVYVLGFAAVGLFFMMRQRWLIWRPAVLCGLAIAAIAGLGELNSWPLVWLGYDTAVSSGEFVVQELAAIAGSFFVNTLVFSISFMAAETLSRRAFPNHIQFWRLWSKPVAASRQVLGRTAAGYLGVSFFLAYIIVFYSLTQRYLGWWIPSDTNVNPDVFAAYVPSFSAIALSTQAGFWEECLFRALPLATFALIGDRFNKRRLFVIAGMIVQALVFGSGHAGYANQPGYARVVELIIPSFVFGGYFLAFGLLPGIIMHYTFDAILMSLPIFAASTPRAHFEQALVVAFVLVPLAVVLVSRWRQGSSNELPAEYRNGAWSPPAQAIEERVVHDVVVQKHSALHPAVTRFMPLIGIASIVVWLLVSNFRSDAPGIAISRVEAEAAARQELRNRGIQFDSSWTVLSRVNAQPQPSDRFVWQTAMPKGYEALIGSYLPPPHWLVRFARFEGDVVERADEYQVLISGSGQVYRVRHVMPETKPGTTATEEEARQVAESVLSQTFRTSLSDLTEVSAISKKRPARTDWTLEFKDKRDYGLHDGEARDAIEVAGREIADARQYVHVPEAWSRDETGKRNLPDELGLMMNVLALTIMVTGAFVAAVRWSRRRAFSTRTFVFVMGLTFVLGILGSANSWKMSAAEFETTRPFVLQAGLLVLVAVVSSVLVGIALGLCAGLIRPAQPSTAISRRELVVAISLGLAIVGVRGVALALVPSLSPNWPDFSDAGAVFPLAASALGHLAGFIRQALLISVIFYAADRISLGLQQRKAAAALLLMVLGLMTSARSIETIPSWLVSGAIIGAALFGTYALVLRYRPELIVVVVAAAAVLSAMQEGLQMAYPSALAGAILGSALIALAIRYYSMSADRVKA